MTPAQLAVFKAAILADTTQASNVTHGNTGAIAAHFATAGAVLIFRAPVLKSAVLAALNWAEIQALTVQQQNALMLFLDQDTVDATLTGTVGILQTLLASAPQSLSNLGPVLERFGTLFELLFVTNSVSSMYGYTPSDADVVAALAS